MRGPPLAVVSKYFANKNLLMIEVKIGRRGRWSKWIERGNEKHADRERREGEREVVKALPLACIRFSSPPLLQWKSLQATLSDSSSSLLPSMERHSRSQIHVKSSSSLTHGRQATGRQEAGRCVTQAGTLSLPLNASSTSLPRLNRTVAADAKALSLSLSFLSGGMPRLSSQLVSFLPSHLSC